MVISRPLEEEAAVVEEQGVKDAVVDWTICGNSSGSGSAVSRACLC